jgi:hypothetical protein
MTALRGRCLCRAVRFEVAGDPLDVAHCHCESCRRATSSPVTTFLVVRRADFRYVEGAPALYQSSPGVRRSFCGRCGSPLAYETDERPDDIDLYVCSLDDPGALAPRIHVHHGERLPWLEIRDQLPRYEGSPRDGEPVPAGPDA